MADVIAMCVVVDGEPYAYIIEVWHEYKILMTKKRLQSRAWILVYHFGQLELLVFHDMKKSMRWYIHCYHLQFM